MLSVIKDQVVLLSWRENVGFREKFGFTVGYFANVCKFEEI